MLNKPIETKPDSSEKQPSQSNLNHNQHGRFSILLAFPAESLTHVTCFLDPPSLVALAKTNKHLNAHVEDDNTWHRAFVYQFLGIAPEGDLYNAKTLLLRRSESSWRKEFVIRHNLRRRWERSHNPTVTHTPHHGSINGIHLMPDAGLLTSSVQYGIVSRSLPLTGKIMKGFLDASGTGLGIGNPNAEFTPNVSTCVLASDGGAVKILWGYRNGEVALTTANRAMDNNRASSKLTRCTLDDEHEGSVQDLFWLPGADAFVSAAIDGRVKLWDKRAKCIWTSDREGGLVAEPFIKVTAIIGLSLVVVGAKTNGDIVVWTGLNPLLSEDTAQASPTISLIRIKSPIQSVIGADASQEHTVKAIHLRIDADTRLSILTHYENHPFVYRTLVDLTSETVDHIQFGDEPIGSISAMKQSFSVNPTESNFVIVGDTLGCISIYDWDGVPISTPSCKYPTVRATRKFEAHEDGAVTAIACNTNIIATGSSRGTTKYWDSLNLALLRSFSSPGARPRAGGEWDGVGNILLEKDLAVISVGSRVLAWRAGPAGSRGPQISKGKGVKRGKKNPLTKGFQQLELHRDINESRKALEYEHAYVQRAYGREREQRSTLDELGLDEVEAVEYALMLSRDEEEARSGGSGPATPPNRLIPMEEEGVFEADSDESATHGIRSSLATQSPPSSLPRTSPSTSNRKIQVSPRFRPEPTEAGFSISPLTTDAIGSSSTAISRTVSTSSIEDFPSISPTQSASPSPSATGWPRRTSSDAHSKVAWGSPRRSPPSKGPSPTNSRRGSVWTSSQPTSSTAPASLLSIGLAQHSSGADSALPRGEVEEMDEDLRFAIELSLAEARSRA